MTAMETPKQKKRTGTWERFLLERQALVGGLSRYGMHAVALFECCDGLNEGLALTYHQRPALCTREATGHN